MISVDATEKWGGNFICTGLCQLRDVEEGGRGKVDCRLKERREKTERGNETKNKNHSSLFLVFFFLFPEESYRDVIPVTRPALPGLYCIFSLLVSRKRGIIKERRGSLQHPKLVRLAEMKNTLLLRIRVTK